MILKTLEFAKDVGATNISITSGRLPRRHAAGQAAKQFAESIKPILDRAEQLDIDVGIECEPGLFLEYVAELREWIDRLGHPRFGANLDIGHSAGHRRDRSPTSSRLLAAASGTCTSKTSPAASTTT